MIQISFLVPGETPWHTARYSRVTPRNENGGALRLFCVLMSLCFFAIHSYCCKITPNQYTKSLANHSCFIVRRYPDNMSPRSSGTMAAGFLLSAGCPQLATAYCTISHGKLCADWLASTNFFSRIDNKRLAGVNFKR